MDYNSRRLDQRTKIQIHITYIKYYAACIYFNILTKPSIKVFVSFFPRNKSENFSSLAQMNMLRIVFAGITNSARFQAGYNFVSYCQRFSIIIFCNIFTNFDNCSCSLMSQFYGNISERISFVFMYVRTADSRLFHFYKNFIIINFRNRKFHDFNFFWACQNCDSGCFWNFILCHFSFPPFTILLPFA